jgi:hypothetical protein
MAMMREFREQTRKPEIDIEIGPAEIEQPVPVPPKMVEEPRKPMGAGGWLLAALALLPIAAVALLKDWR